MKPLLVGILAFVVASSVILIKGIPQPHVPDEFSYLVAANIFAHGDIAGPAHSPAQPRVPHVIYHPSYQSKYPPGQALFLALGQVTTGYPIVGVYISFALMCAAITWMLSVWRLPFWGGILAVFNPVLGFAGYWVQSYWGGAVAALGGALVIGSIRARTGLVFGLGLVVLANSRPFEGLVLAVGTIALVLLKRGPDWRLLLPSLVVLIPASLLMGYYNYRVTGDPLKLPYQVYAETYDVAPKFVFQGLLKPEPEDSKFVDMDLELYKTQRTVVGFMVKNIVFASWWLLVSFNVLLVPLFWIRWKQLDEWERSAVFLYAFFFVGLLLEIPVMVHYWGPVYALNYLLITKALVRWASPSGR